MLDVANENPLPALFAEWNVRDFQRYPGIVHLSPSSVLAQLPP